MPLATPEISLLTPASCAE